MKRVHEIWSRGNRRPRNGEMIYLGYLKPHVKGSADESFPGREKLEDEDQRQ